MEWQLFEPGTVPEYTTPEWYLSREHAPHLEHEPHRSRILLAARYINKLMRNGILAGKQHPEHEQAVVDLGAGDGGLLSLVGGQNPNAYLIGFDLQPANVAYARNTRLANVHRIDVVNDFPSHAFERAGWEGSIAVATEMLEHLVDPHGFLRTVGQHAQWLVASSPYKETGDSYYEFHTWAWDRDGYRELLAQAGYQIVVGGTVDIFQVVLARHEGIKLHND